jgi:hypothetical protein
MIQQTFHGKDILIIHNIIRGKYIVIYEGRTIETDERPVTDQDIERLEQMRRRNLDQRSIEGTSIILGNLLVELLTPLLSNSSN